MNSANRRFLLFMLLLFGTSTTIAQSPEGPKIEFANYPCELISENRVFVEAPLNLRDEIVKQLRKHSDLVIVERPEDADFYLSFTNALQVGGSANLQNESAETAAAGMTVWKLVSDQKGGTRARVLLHWSGQNSFYSVTVPLSGISASGFQRPKSLKSLLGEIIGRAAIELISTKWQDRVQVDQFRNQITMIKGGRLETEGTKWFLQQLIKARNGFYAGTCPGRPLTPLATGLWSFPVQLDSQAPEPVFAPGAAPTPRAPALDLLSGSGDSIPAPAKPVRAPDAGALFPRSAPDLSNPFSELGPIWQVDSPTPSLGRRLIFPPGSSQAPPESNPVRLIEPIRPSSGWVGRRQHVRTH